jgi:uncharacterized membrane protein
MLKAEINITGEMGASRRVLWALIAVFAVGAVLPIFPQVVPRPVMAAAQAVPAALFALIHGARTYRLRGILGFIIISLSVGYLAEALGVHTGFPFGHYSFSDGMGPKVFDVPILMGPAYVGMGYVSWTLARVIANQSRTLDGPRLITLPLAASFVMVAWDIAIDPVLSTFAHYWTWRDGGAFFGVPLSNFLAWYAINYLIYQLFVLYLRKNVPASNSSRVEHDSLAVLFYALCAAGITLRSAVTPGDSVVIDSSGTAWRVGDINVAASMAAIFIMGAFVALALVQLNKNQTAPPAAHLEDRRGNAAMAFSRDELEQSQ